MPTIDIQTQLTTARLLLRAPEEADIDLVWEVSRFEGFNDGMIWNPPETKESLIPIHNRNLSDWQQGVSFTFTIVELATNLSIGRVAIRRTEKRSWNLGFWVHPDYWGKGFATEACTAVITFAKEELAATKITTAHATWNKPSESVIKKLGFEFINEIPCGFYKQGKAVPEMVYEIVF